jgi:hypothetical protein
MAKEKKSRDKAKKSGVLLADSPLVEPVVSALVRGVELGGLRKRLAQQQKITDAEWEGLVQVARSLIVRAASFDAVEEYGKAKKSFEELYQAAWQQGDLKTALSARKEMVALYGLAEERNTRAVEESYKSAVEEQIRAHLEPLGIAPAGTEIVELARRVAVYFCEHFEVKRADTQTSIRKTKTARRSV